MARRRYQRGSLRLEGERWILRWREDVVDRATGLIRRVEQRLVVGVSTSLPTRALARRAADHLLGQINPSERRSGSVVTVREFALMYASDCLPMMKHTSQLAVRSILAKHVVPYFGDRRLDELHGRMLQQFVTATAAGGLRRKTVRNIVSALSRMTRSAKQYGYAVTPVDLGELKFPPDELDIEERFFTPTEAQAIIQAAEYPWRACFALMAYLGLRCGEVLGLAWSHVDVEARLVRIRQSAVMGRLQTVKSRNSKADLPIPDHLAMLLAEYRLVWTPNDAGLLFANPETGNPYWGSNLQVHHLMPILRRLGLPHGGLHAFRHGHATNLFAAGTAAPSVRGLLRHGDLKTTLRYTHLVSEEQRAAVDKVAAVLHRASVDQGTLFHKVGT